MLEWETAYAEIENLVTRFKNTPAAKCQGFEYILPMLIGLGWSLSTLTKLAQKHGSRAAGWVFHFAIAS